MSTPRQISLVEFKVLTEAEGAGLLRMDHRADSAGREFFLSLWYNDLQDLYLVFKASCGESGFTLTRHATKADAEKTRQTYLTASTEPRKDDIEH